MMIDKFIEINTGRSGILCKINSEKSNFKISNAEGKKYSSHISKVDKGYCRILALL